MTAPERFAYFRQASQRLAEKTGKKLALRRFTNTPTRYGESGDSMNRVPVASNRVHGKVEKLLTYVFEDDAALPDATLTLADGLFLAPIPHFLLTQDDARDLLAIAPRFSVFFRDDCHKTTLNVKYPGTSDLNSEGKASGEEQAYRKADHYLLAAMLHVPEFVPPYACFVTIPALQKVCHSNRMKDFGALDRGKSRSLEKPDFVAIDSLYDGLNQVLQPGMTGRLPTALGYYHQAFRTDIDWSVRFLSMMMGIEALFSHGASEISHQVSERSAFFLREDVAQREAVYDEMRALYKMRSDIAHGRTTKGKAKQLETSFAGLLLLLRESLVKVLTNCSLLDLFHAAKAEDFNKAMRSLVFSGECSIQSESGG